MKILYQWEIWAYSNIASLWVEKLLNRKVNDIIWFPDFLSVWGKINDDSIAVLPVENSKAWTIFENIYNFLNFKDILIIWEYYQEINHYLWSLETDIKNIKEVYSHPQALSQCHNFLTKNNFKRVSYYDTAWSCKMIKEKNKMQARAIWSSLIGQIYGLNLLWENIQDQNWNTTRFLVLAKRWTKIKLNKNSNKVSIIFEARDVPSSLYKCLWAFATNWINLTKIESLPSLKNNFSYMFFLEFEWNLKDKNVKDALKELKYFTSFLYILWNY